MRTAKGREQVREALRAARRDTGRTQREVAVAMDWSESKMLRIEAGAVGISPIDLRALLDYYRITDRRWVDRLVALTRAESKERASHREDPGKA